MVSAVVVLGWHVDGGLLTKQFYLHFRLHTFASLRWNDVSVSML
jgi:hypothetical protein